MNNWLTLFLVLLIWNPLLSQGTLTINGGQLTVVGSASIVLKNTKWVNNGTFIAGEGTVILTGDATDETSAIDGTSTSTFHNLEMSVPPIRILAMLGWGTLNIDNGGLSLIFMPGVKVTGCICGFLIITISRGPISVE